MTARLILARHGNTFRPEDTPVWVGARSDVPLVEKGVAQAHSVGDALLAARIALDLVMTGPLKRTRQMTDIVAEKLQLPAEKIRIDERLKEIDYGAWEGQSTNQIIAEGGGEELAAWNSESEFPLTPGWLPVEGQIIADTAAILAEIGAGTTLIISSNGILRFFAALALNARDFPDRKVLTGHLCLMERDAKADWHIRQWNQPPDLFVLNFPPPCGEG